VVSQLIREQKAINAGGIGFGSSNRDGAKGALRSFGTLELEGFMTGWLTVFGLRLVTIGSFSEDFNGGKAEADSLLRMLVME